MTQTTERGKLRLLRDTGWIHSRRWAQCWNCSRRSTLHTTGQSANNTWLWLCLRCEVTWETRARV